MWTGKEMASISIVLAVEILGKASNSGRKPDNSKLSKYEVYVLSVHRGHTLRGHPHLSSFINVYFHWEHKDLAFVVPLGGLDQHSCNNS